MIPVTGKTVYVLGAGASVHAGAPVLSNFLVAARSLLNAEELAFEDSFEAVFEWIDELRGASYYVDFNLDNLEHVFSLIQMAQQVGVRQGEEMMKHVTRLVLETLDCRCALTISGTGLLPDPLYSKFVEILVKLNKERKERLRFKEEFALDAIVTFNYDLMLDYALHANRARPSYHLKGYDTGGYPLLKLHGSTNWAVCSECEKTMNAGLQVIDPTPIPTGEHILPGSDGVKLPFKMVTNVMAKKPCGSCQKKALRPMVVPPTWSKDITKKQIEPVWEKAIQELGAAQQLVVIGYSLPSTDTFLQYLLTLGFETNRDLQRVVIVNSDPDVVERYKKVFARGLQDRRQMQFEPMTFEKFVKGEGAKMQTYGTRFD